MHEHAPQHARKRAELDHWAVNDGVALIEFTLTGTDRWPADPCVRRRPQAGLLHPEIYWTTTAEEDLRGRREVIARLSRDPPPAPPALHEVRDGLMYRWIDCPS